MALTGMAQKTPIKLELFIFASQQAKMRPLETKSTLKIQRPIVDQEAKFSAFPEFGKQLNIRHPYLTDFLGITRGNGRVATHLAGTLAPQQTRQDLTGQFNPPHFHRAQRYTPAAIAERTSLASAVIFAVGVIAIGVLARAWKDTDLLYRTRPILYLMVVATIGGASVYWQYSHQQGKAADLKPMVSSGLHQTVSNLLEKAEKESDAKHLGLTWAREILQQRLPGKFESDLEQHIPGTFDSNHYDAPIPKELDAPLNYTIQLTNQVLKVFTYGHDGAAHLAWKHVSGT